MSIRFVTLPARRLPQMPQLWAIGRCPRDDRRSNAAGTPLDERRLDDREVGMVSYTLRRTGFRLPVRKLPMPCLRLCFVRLVVWAF